MAEKLWNGISGQEFVASRAHKDADGNIIDTTYATKYELSAAISSIPAGAQADWNQTDNTAPDYIKNKPDLEAGDGIDITKNGNTLVFSVSGDYMTSADISDLSAAISGKVDSTTFNNTISELEGSINDVENVVSDLSGAIADKVDTETFNNKVTEIDNEFSAVENDVNYLSGVIDSKVDSDVFEDTISDIDDYITDIENDVNDLSGAITDKVDQEVFDNTVAGINSDINYLSGAISSMPTGQVQADWTETDTTSPAYIRNKPISFDNIQGGDGIEITKEQDTTIISVSADYATEQYVDTGLAMKMDNSMSGDFYPMDTNPSGYLTSNSLDDYATKDYVIFNTSGKVDTDVFDSTISNIDDNFAIVENDINYLSGSVGDKVDNDIFENVVSDIDSSFGLVESDINYLSAAISSMPAGQVQADWNQTDDTEPDYIKNKPVMEAGEGIDITENGSTLVFSISGDYATSTDISMLSDRIDDKLDTSAFNNKVSEIDNNFIVVESDIDDLSGAITDKVDTNVFNDTIAEIDDSFGAVEDDINYLSATISSIPTEQVQSDWTETDITSPAYIQNKPVPLAITEGSGIKIIENQNNIEISVSADYAYTSDVNAAINAVEDEIDVVSGAIVDINADLQNYVSASEFAAVTAVIPSDATSQNQLVSIDTLDSKIADFGGFKVVSVNQQGKPDVSNPKTNIIYLTQDTQVVGKDQFKEWIWDSEAPAASAWKLIGDTSIDLEGYVKAPQSYTPNHVVTLASDNTLFDTGLTTAAITNTQSDWNNTDPNSYAYIHNKPVIPAAPVQSDWTEADTAALSYIKNKPEELDIAAGEGIGITEANNKLTISVSADYATDNDVNFLSGAIDDKVATSTFNDTIDEINDTFEDFGDNIDFLSGAIDNIPAQVQADWNMADSADISYIKNKPASLSIQGGEGIEVSENQDALVIAVSADYATENYVDTALDSKLDVSMSAEFYPMNTNPAGYVTSADLNYYATETYVDAAVSGKVDAIVGMGLSHEDFTSAYKEKLDSISPSAEANVQADWSETDSTADSYIRNKPASLSIEGGDGIEVSESQGNLVIAVSADYATYAWTNTQLADKTDKVIGATAGNFAGLDISGNLTDSTYKASDFATSAQGAKADTAVQDANYVHTDNNYTTTEKNLLASLDTAVSGIEDTIPSNASSLNQLVTKSDLDAAATGAFEIAPLDANDQPDVANPNGKVIYLTKESGSTKTDPYTEWIWLSATSAFEVIGETSIDLTNYATVTDLSGKVDKVTGYGLSKNDFTDALRDKLTDIAPSAEVNVQADWAESNSASDAYIQNKPDVLIPQAGTGVSAVPKYVMVVSAMPAATAIDPYTIYLVQGTYIGT